MKTKINKLLVDTIGNQNATLNNEASNAISEYLSRKKETNKQKTKRFSIRTRRTKLTQMQ